MLPQGAAVAFVLAEVAVNGAVMECDSMVFAQVGAYLFGTEFAADKGVDVLDQLRVELIGFSPALFGQPALPLGLFGTVLLPFWVWCRLISRLMVLLWRLSCLAISAMVQWRGTGIGCGTVRLESVVCSSWQSFLQERPYATAYWPFSVMESCTSNANQLSSENRFSDDLLKFIFY